MPVKGEGWLFKQIGQDATVRKQFIKPSTWSSIDRREVERYIDQVLEF
jgi:hypothetical protein